MNLPCPQILTSRCICSDKALRRIVKLAYRAPDLQRMILDGRQPGWLTLERLTRGEFPISWTDQRAIFASPDPV